MKRHISIFIIIFTVIVATGCISGDEDETPNEETKSYDGTLSSLLLESDDIPERYFVCEYDENVASNLTTFTSENFGFSGVNESIFYRALVNNGNGYTVAALYEWVVQNTSVNNEIFEEIKLRFQDFIASIEKGEVPEGLPEAILEGTYTQYEFNDIGSNAYANVRAYNPPTAEKYIEETNTTYYLLFEKEDAIVILYGYNDGEFGLEEYKDIITSIADRI